MCFDPLSATALILAVDRGGCNCGCGCGCNRGGRRRRSQCGCCEEQTACQMHQGRAEETDRTRQECEKLAARRAEGREAGEDVCARRRAVPCSCDVVRPTATSWSNGAPSCRR